jgi:phosphoglycerate dehydrogenase-like enzyme
MSGPATVRDRSSDLSTTDDDRRVITVTIATPLEAALLAPIRALGDRVSVLYQPELLPPTRYPGDHRGVDGFRRTPEDESRWQQLLAQAEVLFGIPGDSPEGLAAAVRGSARLRWVQGTAAGTGEQLKAAGLTRDELKRVTVTSASGVHVGPLAEFCLLGLLALTKGLPHLRSAQRAHRWDHYPVAELRGATLLVLGLGSIGTEVARLAKAFGMHTLAINRSGTSDSLHVDETHPPQSLHDLLPQIDALVVTLPLTDETAGMLDVKAFELLQPHAILVNVGRGGGVDEPARIGALREQRLAGAVLDVFATEPLPADSPLWDLPNVMLSPHTAALSIHENERLVELFAANLRRYLTGEELVGRIDPTHFF